MTKFMYWLKTNIGKMKITEISAADKLEELRRNDKECFDLSFSTIAGYKEHAAMMHYSATEESDYELKQEGMLLVDSGGQYYTGTTDITRTYILGDITEEQKNNIISKMNEKYGTELKAEEVTIEENTHFRGREILKPYLTPFIITAVIVLAYLAIRYYKLNSLKVIAKAIGIMALAQIILFAIITVTRMPIDVVTMPIVLTLYAISTYVCTTKFDKELEKKKQEEAEKVAKA